MPVMEFSEYKNMAAAAAETIAKQAQKEIKEKGYFTIVLSGGGSPRMIYEKLAAEPLKSAVEWEKVFIFWGDERFVEKTNNDSNYRMANEAFVSKVGVPEDNVFPIPVEEKSPEKTAEVYENTLRDFFKAPENKEAGTKFPAFDLILLGVGADGHTASLFPGNVALNEKKKWVVRVKAHARVTLRDRITMTMPVLSSGKKVMFIISGYGKGEILKSIFRGPEKVKKQYPAGMLNEEGPGSVWYIDKGIYG